MLPQTFQIADGADNGRNNIRYQNDSKQKRKGTIPSKSTYAQVTKAKQLKV